MTLPINLHLGCGDVSLASVGFLNIDCRPGPAVDKVADIATLADFEPGSVSEIYAAHCLDHFDRWTYRTVLRRWVELLRHGGKLRLAMPDFEAICEEYRLRGDLHDLQGILYARQDYPTNTRHFIWDFTMAKQDLEAAGLVNIHRYEWRFTGWGHIDDCSQAYLPRGDKEHGRLMSLNVVGYKP